MTLFHTLHQTVQTKISTLVSKMISIIKWIKIALGCDKLLKPTAGDGLYVYKITVYIVCNLLYTVCSNTVQQSAGQLPEPATSEQKSLRQMNIEIADNLSLCFQMLRMSTGHMEGDLQPLYLLLTDCYIYLLRKGKWLKTQHALVLFGKRWTSTSC